MPKKILNVLFYIIAAFYLFMMVDLFFRFSYLFDVNREITRSYNLIPFQTIWQYIRGHSNVSRSFIISNVIGNIVVFIPFGVYLQTMLKRKRFVNSLLLVVLIAVVIEAVQFAFGLGASDIDDVLLNSLGGMLGILLYNLLRKICKEEARTKTVITFASLVIGVPIIYLYFTTVFNHLRL